MNSRHFISLTLVAATAFVTALVTTEVRAASSRFSAEDEAVYQQRFATLMESFRSGLGLETYDPLESVPGATDDQAFEVVDAENVTINAEALAQAEAYAAANRSIALLVWQGGKLQMARYFQGDANVRSRNPCQPSRLVAP
ncbi:MAG: hypothetical protein EBR00_02405 [Gammaproteobacteria bacterium]|nr:hypothetical protein [Gammaproteobacteria bacterium]